LITSGSRLSFLYRSARYGRGTGQSDKLNVFISYNRDDLALADQLGASLRLGGVLCFRRRIASASLLDGRLDESLVLDGRR